MEVRCTSCWNGRVLDTEHPEYDGAIDRLFDTHPSSDLAFAEASRQFPDAVINCKRCEGTGKITIGNPS
jgi:hypothetical protein